MTPVFSYAVQPVTLRNLHSMDHSERQLVEEIASFVGADLRYDPLVLFGGNGDHQIDEMRWIMALIRSWNLARWMWWWKPQARTHRSRRSRSPTVAMYKASIMRILTASPSPKAIPLYPLVTSLSRDTKTHRVVNPGLQKPTGWVGEEALLIGFEGNESVRFFSTESICQCMFRPCLSRILAPPALEAVPTSKGNEWSGNHILCSLLIWISGGFHWPAVWWKKRGQIAT